MFSTEVSSSEITCPNGIRHTPHPTSSRINNFRNPLSASIDITSPRAIGRTRRQGRGRSCQCDSEPGGTVGGGLGGGCGWNRGTEGTRCSAYGIERYGIPEDRHAGMF